MRMTRDLLHAQFPICSPQSFISVITVGTGMLCCYKCQIMEMLLSNLIKDICRINFGISSGGEGFCESLWQLRDVSWSYNRVSCTARSTAEFAGVKSLALTQKLQLQWQPSLLRVQEAFHQPWLHFHDCSSTDLGGGNCFIDSLIIS